MSQSPFSQPPRQLTSRSLRLNNRSAQYPKQITFSSCAHHFQRQTAHNHEHSQLLRLSSPLKFCQEVNVIFMNVTWFFNKVAKGGKRQITFRKISDIFPWDFSISKKILTLLIKHLFTFFVSNNLEQHLVIISEVMLLHARGSSWGDMCF